MSAMAACRHCCGVCGVAAADAPPAKISVTAAARRTKLSILFISSCKKGQNLQYKQAPVNSYQPARRDGDGAAATRRHGLVVRDQHQRRTMLAIQFEHQLDDG